MNDISYVEEEVKQDIVALILIWKHYDPTKEIPFTFEHDLNTLFELSDEYQANTAMTLFNLIKSMWEWHPGRPTQVQWDEVINAFDLNRMVRELPSTRAQLERGRLEHVRLYYVVRALVRAVFWLAVVAIFFGLVWVIVAALRVVVLVFSGQL